MRLGSEVQLGTSIATFSADGAGSFVLKASQQRENNARLACAGAQTTRLEVSTQAFSPGPLPLWLSAPQILQKNAAARSPRLAAEVRVGSVLGSAHTVRGCHSPRPSLN